MNICYEYRSDVRRSGKPQMKARADMVGLQGFTTLYGFDEDTVDYIKDTGGTYGLEGAKLYSDILYIDVDKDKDTAYEVYETLLRLGLEFTEYASGSPDSYHFHVKLEPMYDVGIQYVQKQWVKENFGTKVDLSIYKTSGLIRLIGSYHKKHPGKSKKFICNHPGKTLNLNDYETHLESGLPKIAYFDNENTDYGAIIDSLLMDGVSDGGRNNAIFKRAAAAKDAGWALEKTIEALEAWNSLMVNPPKPKFELIRTIKSAYRRFGT